LAGGAAGYIFGQVGLHKLKKRVEILETRINLNQEDILKNYHMIDLTRLELGQHRKLLHNLDLLTIRLNHDLSHLYNDVIHQAEIVTAMFIFKGKVDTFRNARMTMEYDLKLLYRYLDVMANRKVTPVLLPPAMLTQLLKAVQEQLQGHPRLSLPADIKNDVWSYYQFMTIVPTIVGQYMVVSLEIPLVDASSAITVYRTYNLPAVHPEMNLNFQYELEGKYIGVSQDQEYFMLPRDEDVEMCEFTQGFACRMRTAMYPVQHVNWCIAALFLNDQDKIKSSCMVKIKEQTTNIAYNVGQNLWAVSALVNNTVRVRCLYGTRLVKVQPPLQIIQVPNGCEAYVTDVLWIPASNHIVVQNKADMLPENRFLDFNLTYVPLKNLSAYHVLTKHDLTKEQLEELSTDLLTYDQIPMYKVQVV
jgi:hypothetical protein